GVAAGKRRPAARYRRGWTSPSGARRSQRVRRSGFVQGARRQDMEPPSGYRRQALRPQLTAGGGISIVNSQGCRARSEIVTVGIENVRSVITGYADFARLAAATKFAVVGELASLRYAIPTTKSGGAGVSGRIFNRGPVKQSKS